MQNLLMFSLILFMNFKVRKLQTSIRARNISNIQQITQIPIQHKRPYRVKAIAQQGVY